MILTSYMRKPRLKTCPVYEGQGQAPMLFTTQITLWTYDNRVRHTGDMQHPSMKGLMPAQPVRALKGGHQELGFQSSSGLGYRIKLGKSCHFLVFKFLYLYSGHDGPDVGKWLWVC